MKTFGKFYREDVLSKEPLVKRELPPHSEKIRVVKDLFGWKLFSGGHYVDCRSEQEAKFLKIFLEVGFEEVMVPEDDKVLAKLLKDLEEMQEVAQEIIEEHAEGLISQRTREELRHRIWQELAK